jgi:hypothetical protein
VNGTAGRTWAGSPAGEIAGCEWQFNECQHYTVTLIINSSNGGNHHRRTAVLQNGIATFSSLTVNKAGNGYTLTPGCICLRTFSAQNSDVFNKDPCFSVLTA